METISIRLAKSLGKAAFILSAVCIASGIGSYSAFAKDRISGQAAVSAETGSAEKGSGASQEKKTDGAAATGGSAKEKKAASERDVEEKTVPFDQALDLFFSETDSMTDSEILKSAKKIRSDGDLLDSRVGRKTGEKVMAAVEAYESAKADYIMAKINGEMSSKEKKEQKETETLKAAGLEMTARDGVCREWDRQSDYTQMMIAEDSAVREMIPRFQITSCEMEGDVLRLGVDEWMTQGYGEADGKGPENASSYIYSFSVSLRQTAGEAWTPFAINDTEVNFSWLTAAQTDPEVETADAPDTLYEVKSDMSPEAIAYAKIVSAGPADSSGTGGKDREAISFAVDESAVVVQKPGLQGSDESLYADAQARKTGSLKTSYYSGYDADDAIAYANRYWKHYNRQYHEYRGLDCCNFVSQCLSAGGMPHTDTWFPNSVAWINVPAAKRHFSQYGALITANNTSVRRGNPVYYDWQGDGVYDHTTLCVGTNASGMPVVDGHTSNVYHVPWRMGGGGSRQTILLNKKSASSSRSRNTWKTVDGKVYYLDKNGHIVTGKFMDIDGSRYYFNGSGVRVTGFFKTGGNWYYASVKTGKLLKGFQWIGGHTYYFSCKNYVRFSGGRYWIGGYTYYFSSKGIRKTGFIKTGGKRYYADKKNGRFVTGWKKISGKWYYFNKKTMVMATGWRTINGRRCYFDSKGVLKKGRHG